LQQVAARFDKYQKLYVQCELLMMGGSSTRNTYSVIEINKQRKVAICTVRAPDDGWRFHPKHVERYGKK
jgi:hypothetical protein